MVQILIIIWSILKLYIVAAVVRYVSCDTKITIRIVMETAGEILNVGRLTNLHSCITICIRLCHSNTIQYFVRRAGYKKRSHHNTSLRNTRSFSRPHWLTITSMTSNSRSSGPVFQLLGIRYRYCRLHCKGSARAPTRPVLHPLPLPSVVVV